MTMACDLVMKAWDLVTMAWDLVMMAWDLVTMAQGSRVSVCSTEVEGFVS